MQWWSKNSDYMQILQLHYIYIAKYRDIVSVRILRTANFL